MSEIVNRQSSIVNCQSPNRLLITGATGYIGGRLVPLLLEAGYTARLLVRDPARLQGRPWLTDVEVVQGDVLQPDSLAAAMAGVDAAYYLIHSMSGSHDFHERDLLAARNFGQSAKAAGVKRIIYLGGLGDGTTELSPHLRSRQETGAALRESGVPVTEFRAAVIVGSGSISFEMIRYLAERLPVMIGPRWLYTKVQPIGIRNALQYLVACLDTPESAGEIIEIGGADVLSYSEMVMGYARVRGLRRWLIPVPILSPRISSHWVHWLTPIPASIARPLIEGLRNEVVVGDRKALELFPQVEPLTYETAVHLALARLEAREVETSWSDALFSSQQDVVPARFTMQEGMMIERRQRVVEAPASAVFQAFSRLGGDRGWPNFNWAWRLRGIADRLVGGVGFRRGRRDPDELRVGDALDFWRVEEVRPDRLLRLRAEMKVPGRAWLQFEAEPLDPKRTRLTQTAFFAPKGLSGLLYWYALYPFHGPIFSGMITRLAAASEADKMTRLEIRD